MNQPNPQEIERRLAEQPAAPPPPELLASLEAEIPEPGEVWEERQPPAASTTRRWLIAASLTVAVAGGLLGYRVLREPGVSQLNAPLPRQQDEPRIESPAPSPAGNEAAAVEDLAAPQAPPHRPADAADAPRPAPPPTPQSEPVAAAPPTEAETLTEPLLGSQPGPPAGSVTRSAGTTDDSDGLAAGAEELKAAVESLARGERESQIVEAEPRAREVTTVTSESPLLEAGGAAARVEIAGEPVSPRMPAPQEFRAYTRQRPVGREAPGASAPAPAPPSTGGTREPNDEPYGDVFYREYGVNPFIDTDDDALSTFGLDVDTGSYTIVRRYLEDGNLPPREAIRVEEMINYFDYGDAPPRRGDFALHAELAPTPFTTNDRYRLLRFGIRGREISEADRKPATLIFVVDVSGSMDRGNRLGLVKESLTLLLARLRPEDRIGLVIYGSHGEVLLDPTGDHEAIRRAIERLRAGGSTNAEEGLTLAYELASRHYREGAINRILLCSDGVANVGRTGPESILERVRAEATRGIELTTVGFGMGNYNDVLMEQLANQGDGSYAYVDDLREARRIFVENLTGTLQTIAADAKVQVEFNPEVVSRYRLLGYENRDIADERFRDDTVDAGEIGAGHAVTALYEVKLVENTPRRQPLATLRLRYRSKESGRVVELEHPVRGSDGVASWKKAPAGLKLAATVAEFGEILKSSYWAREGGFDQLLPIAQQVSAELPGDEDGAELVGLIARASRIAERAPRD